MKEATVVGKKERRQKQVDIALTVDMLTHAFHKNMWHASLIAGDQDFKPLVDALVLLGTHVHIFFERSSASSALYDAADVAAEMTLRTHPIPVVLSDPAPSTAIVRHGTCNGRIVQHQIHGSDQVFWVHPSDEEPALWVSFHDLEKLERFFGTVYGPISW